MLSVLQFIVFASVVTGRHVVFPLHLTWQEGAPDGNTRYMVHTNGQFPAPELRLRYGDTVEVTTIESASGT